MEPQPELFKPAWTPKSGLVVKHRVIDQRVELVEEKVFDGLKFWMIRLKTHGDQKPWMIGEVYLIEQYKPIE